jgi:hypothetical protein
MTSIEWLQNEIYLRGPVGDGPDDIPKWLKDLYEKAKEIHKQEIIDAYVNGQSLGFDDSPKYWAEKYHQETFVSKGSYVNGDIVTKDSVILELPQQEISDEEIEKWAKEYTCKEYGKLIFDYENYDTYGDFVNGAKKYREQLKQRQNGQ